WLRPPRLRVPASPGLRVLASPRLRVSASPRLRISASPRLRVRFFSLQSFIIVITVGFALYFATNSSSSRAQTKPRRSGAHSIAVREAFTPADRLMVERAIGAACTARLHDPLGSIPIDEMQA